MQAHASALLPITVESGPLHDSGVTCGEKEHSIVYRVLRIAMQNQVKIWSLSYSLSSFLYGFELDLIIY